MRRLKAALDPAGILNPGCVLPLRTSSSVVYVCHAAGWRAKGRDEEDSRGEH